MLTVCAARRKVSEDGQITVQDKSGKGGNVLLLRSSAPQFVYSTAPLSTSDGKPVKGPQPGAGGYSLALHDKQVLMHTNFQVSARTAWWYPVE